MTTADLIREHLGERWWEREHDGTAILALVDRIREVEETTIEETLHRIYLYTADTIYNVQYWITFEKRLELAKNFCDRCWREIHLAGILVE